MKKKTHTLKPTKKQLEILKQYWFYLSKITEEYYMDVEDLEKKMSEKTGIENIEFFSCDGDYCGIGNQSRTMKLIHQEELENR